MTDELALIQTVDIFPPAVDDPYEYGQIAAANSLSDVWAMGGKARLCMNILMYPEDMPPDAVNAILRGGYDKVMEAGAIVVGGHTIKDDIPKYGLCVSGIVHPDKILKNNAIRENDILILTKAIGTGLLINATKGEIADEAQYKSGLDSMVCLNKYAAEAVQDLDGIHACTDVTGFSIIGHSFEMCEGTGLQALINHKKVPFLPGAEDFAKMGLVPAATYANRRYLKKHVGLLSDIPEYITDILYDPQTSGGLLYSVDQNNAPYVLEALKKVCPYAEAIGKIIKGNEHPISII